MGLFQKLPVDIEARQFETNNENGSPHMDGLVQWIKSNGGEAFHDKTSIYVHTLEGQHRASVGDWIIRGVKGEFYPCKPAIFAATYKAVTASTPGTGKDEAAIEAEIQAKGLNAPRLNPAAIDATIVGEDYHVFPGTTLTVCRLALRNGFSVTGESAAASPENFDEAIGRKIARDNARNKIWALEGYLLRERLSGGSV